MLGPPKLPLRLKVNSPAKLPEGLNSHGVLISAHAIDRAFERCHQRFLDTRLKDEALLSWLGRLSQEALEKRILDDAGELYVHDGFCFAIRFVGGIPVLNTIFPADGIVFKEGEVANLRERLLAVVAAHEK